MNTLNGYSKSTLSDLYALTASGGHFPIHSGRNNEANAIVRTDANGYINTGWINTTSGAFTGTPSRIYASNDAYIRYMTPANFFPTLSNTDNLLNITVAGLNRKLTIAYSYKSDITRYIECVDTRSVVIDPTTLDAAKGVMFDFKQKSVTGLTAAYSGIMTFRPYSNSTDWSGGPAHLLAFDANGLHHRTASSATWGSWSDIVTTTYYSDKLSGYITSSTASLSSYWGKLWDVTRTSLLDDLDMTFYIHSAYNNERGFIHLRARRNSSTTDGVTTYSFGCWIKQITGNLTKSRFRLYYNASSGKLQLWCNVNARWCVYNCKIISSTFRTGKELLPITGTLYTDSFTTAQTLPTDSYTELTNVREPDYVLVSLHNTNDTEYPLVWSNETNTSTKTSNLLYKSYNNLTYNPKNNRITASIFKGNLLGNINPLNSYSTTTTVKDAKDWIVTQFSGVNAGIGANVIVSESVISLWNNDSAALYASSSYSVIKIGGGYSGTTYGLWLLSSHNNTRVGYVGRSGNNWSSIYWLATTSDIDTLKNYYWANVKISATSSTTTTPTFATATATTQVTTPKVHSDGRLTLNTTSTGLDLKWNNDNTKSVILNGTAFKPFDDANNNLTLGSTSARWSTIYGVNGNFSGTVKMYTGDASLAIYSGRITDAKSDGNICFLTSIDNTDPQSHSYPTLHLARCNISLLPRGGLVYIGTNPDGGNTNYKLYVNGAIYGTSFAGNVAWSNITDKPSFFSGNYNDLTNKPTSLPANGGSANKLNSTNLKSTSGLHYYYAGGITTSTDNTGNYVGPNSNTTYSSVLRLQSHATSGLLYYRDLIFDVNSDSIWSRRVTNSGTPSLVSILHSGNSSVSGGGSSWGSSITVKINDTTATLTIPSNPNTWRPITDSYSGTVTTTSLSQKGANDLYNAVIGSIPTVNNGKITIKLNGTEIGSFTMNLASANTIELTDTTYSLVGANGTTGLIKNGSTVTSATGYIACPIINGVPYYQNTTLGNSGVTAGTYTPTPSTVTNSTHQSIQVPKLAINAQGLITKASLKNVPITGSFYIASNKTLANSDLSFITSIAIAPGYTVTFPTPSASNEGKIIFVKAAYGNSARYVSGKIATCNSICSTASTTTIDIGYYSHIFVCMDYGSGFAWVDYYCG